MPDAPRHTQDTWIPKGPAGAQEAPPSGPASADPGYEAASLGHKTDAARRTGGADTAHRPGGTDTGSAGAESPLVAAHPQPGAAPAGTHGTAPTTTEHIPEPGPDGTGTHTPGVSTGTGTHTPGDSTGTGTHTSGVSTGTHTPGTGPDGTGTHTPGTGDRTTAPGAHHTHTTHGHSGHHTPDARLLPDDTCDRLDAQLRQAVAGFVDRPRDAVEEADLVLHELTERLTDALTERRRTLAQHWKAPASGDPKDGSAPDTEQLRLALRDYRELAERLLGV